MWRVVFLLPAVALTGVSGWFNYLFSQTLGDDATKWPWVLVGIAAAAGAALGLDAMRFAWRRGSPLKAFCGLVFWIGCIAYDCNAAYGFATREQASAAQRFDKARDARNQALRNVERANEALQPYEDAEHLSASTAIVAAFEKRTNDARCRLPKLGDDEREMCLQLTKARLAAARAEARARLVETLKEAERVLVQTPMPPPQDRRAELLGADALAWLPVVLLQLGTVFGVFATAIPKEPKPEEESEETPMTEAAEENQSASTPRASAAGHGTSVIELVSSIVKHPDKMPEGLRLDPDGWIRGGQRRFATAAGIPLTRFNRDVKAAWRKGYIELRTSGNETAVRLGSAGNA